jgi:hypothetical protein
MRKTIPQLAKDNGYCCAYAYLSALRLEGKWRTSELQQLFGMSGRATRQAKQFLRNGEWSCEKLLQCTQELEAGVSCPSGTAVQLPPFCIHQVDIE